MKHPGNFFSSQVPARDLIHGLGDLKRFEIVESSATSLYTFLAYLIWNNRLSSLSIMLGVYNILPLDTTLQRLLHASLLTLLQTGSRQLQSHSV